MPSQKQPLFAPKGAGGCNRPYPKASVELNPTRCAARRRRTRPLRPGAKGGEKPRGRTSPTCGDAWICYAKVALEMGVEVSRVACVQASFRPYPLPAPGPSPDRCRRRGLGGRRGVEPDPGGGFARRNREHRTGHAALRKLGLRRRRPGPGRQAGRRLLPLRQRRFRGPDRDPCRPHPRRRLRRPERAVGKPCPRHPGTGRRLRRLARNPAGQDRRLLPRLHGRRARGRPWRHPPGA